MPTLPRTAVVRAEWRAGEADAELAGGQFSKHAQPLGVACDR